MRKFILKLGETFIDIFVWILFIATIIFGFYIMDSDGFLAGFFAMIIGLVSNVILVFFVYLWIDIRHQLIEIAKNKKDEQ